MNIRDLEYFSAVAQHEHFGRAAGFCHVSQPALSNQIKKLESELGVKLFERDNRRVQLTISGQNILPIVQDILSGVERLQHQAHGERDPFRGVLHIGAIPTIAPYLVPALFEDLGHHYPQLQPRFEEDVTGRLVDRILAGDLDVAILATKPSNEKLNSSPLYQEAFWVLCPTSHPILNLAKIKPADLPHDELLILNEGHCFRDQMLELCQLDPDNMALNVRANTLETLIKMVAIGRGITLVPERAINPEWHNNPRFALRRFDDPRAYRQVYLTTRKTYPKPKLITALEALIK